MNATLEAEIQAEFEAEELRRNGPEPDFVPPIATNDYDENFCRACPHTTCQRPCMLEEALREA